MSSFEWSNKQLMYNHQMTSRCFIVVLCIYFFGISQSIEANQLGDLIESVRKKNGNSLPRSKASFVAEFRDIVQTIQENLQNSSATLCLPGFHAFEGSCYFLSPIRSTWLTGSDACALKRNATLVAFETQDELNFVVEKLMKPSQAKHAFIGLFAREIGQWQWLDGRTFYDSIFGPLFYDYRRDTSHCGLINLVTQREVAIEGRDCVNDEARFICKYVQNHCYAKHVCGRGGECLNLGLTHRCQCNFLYRGRKCDKLSSTGVQSIIALLLICLMGLVGCCLKLDLYSYCKSKKRHSHDEDCILNSS